MTLVHPAGMPLAPDNQFVDDGVTNVPVDGTLSTQLYVQSDAEISVARHFM